jgi:hypothetical protein
MNSITLKNIVIIAVVVFISAFSALVGYNTYYLQNASQTNMSAPSGQTSILAPSGQTSILAPSGQTSILAPSGQTSISKVKAQQAIVNAFTPRLYQQTNRNMIPGLNSAILTILEPLRKAETKYTAKFISDMFTELNNLFLSQGYSNWKEVVDSDRLKKSTLLLFSHLFWLKKTLDDVDAIETKNLVTYLKGETLRKLTESSCSRKAPNCLKKLLRAYKSKEIKRSTKRTVDAVKGMLTDPSESPKNLY